MNIISDKNILVTGGAGFIGSNFILYVMQNVKNCNIINLDLLTYASDLKSLESNLAKLDFIESKETLLRKTQKIKNYHFIQGDINDSKLLEKIFKKHKINCVIHFAAQSHVDNSINSPEIFVKTNINGTFTLLNAAFRAWFDSPFKAKKAFKNALFYHISTDEVFGSLGPNGRFSETSPYQPNSPYSASKASSDMLVRSFSHTFGLNAVISNCSNNYGEFQHDEKLIPTIIRAALQGKKIPIYGDGKNVRDWLYVKDHCDAILRILGHVCGILDSKNLDSKQDLAFFDTFCIGGNEEKQNIDIAYIICNILDKKVPKNETYSKQITFVQDRFGHDRRYAIDSTKLKNTLNWQPAHTFTQGIEKTIEYYIAKYTKDYKK